MTAFVIALIAYIVAFHVASCVFVVRLNKKNKETQRDADYLSTYIHKSLRELDERILSNALDIDRIKQLNAESGVSAQNLPTLRALESRVISMDTMQKALSSQVAELMRATAKLRQENIVADLEYKLKEEREVLKDM